MHNEQNIKAWLDSAPHDVAEKVDSLLEEVRLMRDEQVIYPAQGDILNAIGATSPESVRVVILGQDPYHEPGQAMGLSFSVPEGCKLPPSLRNIYKELVADLGCAMPRSGDLSSWAKQGVLLLNTTLTVREHAANSHSKLGWQVLTSYLVSACMELPQPIVFLLWGKPAIRLASNALQSASGLHTKSKFILVSTHPSPLSANRAASDAPAFMGSRPFSKANAILQENGSAPIVWESVC